jgi:hypothetical protein
MTNDDADKIGAAFAKHMKGGGNSAGATSTNGLTDSSGKLGSAFNALGEKMNPLGSSVSVAEKAFGAASSVVKDLEAVIKPSVSTWRDLSKSGANFGNDVVSMSAAAAGARLDLGEFADVVKKNASGFTGLGGNVAAGAKAFASLSKDFADSGAVDELKKIGLTSKDANDSLALALSSQFTVNMNDAKSKQAILESTSKLATEMDAMSKLTGKTRAEQEDLLKKQQMDAQYQAKLQLDTMGMSAEDAIKYRREMDDAYKKAQLQGMGDVFKEVYATGTVQTEAAANKMGLLPEQAQATEREIAALRKGNYDEAKKEQQNRELQISKDAKDRSKLELITLGESSTAAKVLGDQFINTQATAKAYASAQQSLLDTNNKSEEAIKFRNASKEEQDRMLKDKVDKDIAATQDSSSAGSKSTEALVKLESRAQDVSSAFMNGIVKPINEKLAPSFDKLNNSVLNAKMVGPDGKQTTQVKQLEGGMNAGVDNSGKESKPGEKGNFTTEGSKNSKTGEGAESTLYGIGKGAGGIVGEVAGAINKVMGVEPKKMAEGGVVPPTSGGTTVTVGEAGKAEAIVPLDKFADKTITGAQGPGAKSQSKEKTEDESEMSAVDRIKARLADRQAKVAALEKIATERELTDLEQKDLRIANFGVRRAQNNLAAQLERDEIEAKAVTEAKNKTLDIKKSEIAEVTKQNEELNGKKKAEVAEVVRNEDIKKAAVTAQSVFSSMATIGLTTDQKKMFGEFSSMSKEDSDKKRESLKVEEESARAANKAAMAARDAIEEKAELEKRKMTEAEEAQFKALGVELNSSSKRIDSVRDAQKVLERADEDRTFQAKVQANQVEAQKEAATRYAEIVKLNAATIGNIQVDSLKKTADNVKETVTINGKVVDPDSPEAKSVRAKMEVAKKQVEELLNPSTKAAQAVTAEVSKSAGISAPNIKPPSVKELQEQYAKMSTAQDADPEKLKALKGQIDSARGMPDFGSMFGGEKGKAPPFMESLNAKLAGMKPVTIKTEEEANKSSTKTAGQTIKSEQQKKEEEAKAKEAQAAKDKGKTEDKPKAVGTVEQVTLKDLHTSLEHLNKSMASLVSFSQKTADAAQQQVKATKGLSGNKFA